MNATRAICAKMRQLSLGATFSIVLLQFCCFSNGNPYVLKRDVPAISLIQKRSWCSGLNDKNQFLQIDLRRAITITGVASRKDDGVTEFKLSYRKNNDQAWYFYQEDGSVKIFRTNEKSTGHFSRHWLENKITTRHVKFHVTKWERVPCLHVEIYGWKNREMRMDVLKKDRGRSPLIFQLVDREGKNNAQKLAKDSGEDNSHSHKPTPNTQDKKSNMRLTIIVCFLVTGVIAILGLIIVCKWDSHERRIRPEYLRANLRSQLGTNLRRTK